MKGLLRLRRGERLNPAEFSDGFLAPMHARLDALAAEQARDSRRELIERFVSHLMQLLAWIALAILVGLYVAAGLGVLS